MIILLTWLTFQADFSAHFTRLDVSESFLPSEIGPNAIALQVNGMLTQKCGGVEEWWRNPR